MNLLPYFNISASLFLFVLAGYVEAYKTSILQVESGGAFVILIIAGSALFFAGMVMILEEK